MIPKKHWIEDHLYKHLSNKLLVRTAVSRHTVYTLLPQSLNYLAHGLRLVHGIEMQMKEVQLIPYFLSLR